MSLIWVRALVPGYGTGWCTTVRDGRQVAVVQREAALNMGRRWFVYAKPHDCDSWGNSYTLHGIGSLDRARAYVENDFKFPEIIPEAVETVGLLRRIFGGAS